ncbi:ABC transporter substrate-binding protein [Ralstonia syzygii]|uniref:ABC transporter substrate-binding protein n=1 Tax=Ralstonia syzygii TaxID=28097 RepID=UPI0023DC2D78|nr:ABC transporter substrate-binding protein [Ralstonia syzygii]
MPARAGFFQAVFMMRKRFIILTASVTSVAVRAVHAEVITVAQVLPLEGSVDMSTRAAVEAAERYLRKVNDAGGMTKLAEDVLRVNAGAILMFSDSINIGGFLRAYRERGGNAVVTTDSTPSADELVRASSIELARSIRIAEVMPAIVKRNTRLVRAFVADMTAGGRPDLARLTAALEGYVSARLFVEAVRRISGPVTGEDGNPPNAGTSQANPVGEIY